MMVIKPQENLFDERSAGGLVYKQENNKIFWLLIKTLSGQKSESYGSKSKPQRSVYKFPKGHLKDNEFLKQAALREVEEEGRVKAKILTKLGSNDYVIWDKEQKRKIVKKVTFFLMEYLGQSNLKYYDTEMVLERSWFSFEEALGKLAFESEKLLLKKAKAELDNLLKK